MSGSKSTNGTYDRDVFTERAIQIIKDHNTSEPLFLYVAFHNVHDACQKDRFALGVPSFNLVHAAWVYLAWALYI